MLHFAPAHGGLRAALTLWLSRPISNFPGRVLTVQAVTRSAVWTSRVRC